MASRTATEIFEFPHHTPTICCWLLEGHDRQLQTSYSWLWPDLCIVWLSVLYSYKPTGWWLADLQLERLAISAAYVFRNVVCYEIQMQFKSRAYPVYSAKL
jgi:hypothetical protein